MLTYNDVARNFEPRVDHSNILKLGIPKRRWRTSEFAFWRPPQQHFGKCRIEKVNGTAVLLKDTRSSETEKAGRPQPIKEIQSEDPIEASSVWGTNLFHKLAQLSSSRWTYTSDDVAWDQQKRCIPHTANLPFTMHCRNCTFSTTCGNQKCQQVDRSELPLQICLGQSTQRELKQQNPAAGLS